MPLFSILADSIASTRKKSEKIRLLADYFRSRGVDEAAQAAIFLSGRVFPAWEERTLQAGGSLLWRALAEVSGKPDVALTAAYRKFGDMGLAGEELLAAKESSGATLSLADLAAAFDQIARSSGAAQKLPIIVDLLRRAAPVEAKYIIKIISGDLRIGLRESLVEEAIAAAFGAKLAEVQRANMLLGDIAETLRLAAAHALGSAQMRIFHPVGFMLASPAQSPQEAFSYFSHAQVQVQVEDKYDGIRAQAHVDSATGPNVRIFSRTLDEISPSFPELVPALRAFPEPVVLDGEILAWSGSTNQALPFSELQKRLGRKKVSESLVRGVPVVYMVFDILFAGGRLTLEEPLAQRRQILEQLFAAVPEGSFSSEQLIELEGPQGKLVFEPAVTTAGSPRVLLAPCVQAHSAEHLAELFEQAR
ncbi:MAG TPA: hypothetical protein VJN64_14370, partial [Terriglobales bacterium]|nr:hypothetical protein [Terriglobales bacterium]